MNKKVILNDCYGGYGWSKQGVIEVLHKKGFEDLHYWLEQQHSLIEVQYDVFISGKRGLWLITIGDFNPNEKCGHGRCYNEFSFDREDPDAIEVLERFGSEFCSDSLAELIVQEFDDEYFGYKIDEYDGAEILNTYPKLTLGQVLKCNSVSEVAEILQKIGVIKESA